MSNDQKTANVTSVPTSTSADAEPKRNFFQRKIVDPIKSHPKLAIAAAAGAGLVGVAAFAGRKSAQYDVVLELQPAPEPDVEPVTVIDTTVAN